MNGDLFNVEHTGYKNTKILPVNINTIDGKNALLLFNAGNCFGINLSPVIIVADKIKYNSEYELSLPKSFKILSVQQQVLQLKKVMGLNISEIAAILFVTRPTVYEWIDNPEQNLRSNHRERLTELSEICDFWEQKKIGHLGSFLHKIFDKLTISLFNLLTTKKLDLEKIYCLLDDIGVSIKEKMLKKTDKQELLKKYGFKEISKEETEKRLNDFITTIG